MQYYPMDYFYNLLPELGFNDIEIFVFVTKSNNDPHPFVLAKKVVNRPLAITRYF